MKVLYWLGIAMAGIMAAVIVWAVSQSPIGADFSAITARPWGVVSLVDLYAGLALAGAWIAYREQRISARIGWIVGVAVLGNLAVGVYVAVAARQAIAAADVGVLLNGPQDA